MSYAVDAVASEHSRYHATRRKTMDVFYPHPQGATNLMICFLIYNLKFYILIIYKPFYEATVYRNTKSYFLKHSLSPIAISWNFFIADCYWWLIMFKRILSYVTVHDSLIKKDLWITKHQNFEWYFNLQIIRNLRWFIIY